ncbi:conserved hypothetical protein [Luteimonas sp. 9C]|uniref:hypothetical protein n=1 Tax=Luteimonas sp. 9C TaxID=2653148 RepID=UPI0012F29CD7|nr:hypothetical protein [Luteimonas sp. 9C]VXA91692.1 conserved hypothetical protein [Luteimonas sp. 9C]
MAQGTRNGTLGLALAATVLVHVGIAWWLLSLRQTAPAHGPAALAVIWIARQAPPLPSPALPPAPVPATSDTATPPLARGPRSHALQAVEVQRPSIDDQVPLPGAAALLEQAGTWARQQAPAADFVRDPLRHRASPAADGRFAMREPVSVEDVVIAVGSLFGGGPSDPCPRIRRNLAALGTGGDAALTAEELRRLQQYCL